MEITSNFSSEAVDLLIYHVDKNYSEMTLREVAKEYHLTLEVKEYVNGEDKFFVYDWEKMNDEEIEKVVKEYLESHNSFLGFTENKTKVLFYRGY